MFDTSKVTLTHTILLALILRLIPLASIAFLHTDQALYEGDSGSYIEMARAFATGDILFGDSSLATDTIYRTPGYPVFLGILYFLSLGDLPIAFIQIILDIASLYFIFQTAKIMFGEKAAIFAGVLYALNPTMILFSFKLLSENVFNFVFIVTNYYFIRSLYKDEKQSVLLGALFSILSIIRPGALLFSFIYALVLYIRNRNVREAFVIVILSLVLPALWTLHNYVYLGYPTFTGIPEVNTLCWQAGVIAQDPAVDAQKWGPFIKEYSLTDINTCNQLPYETIKRGAPVAAQFMGDNFVLYMKHFVKAAVLFFAPATPNYALSAFGQEEQVIHFSTILVRGFNVGEIASLLLARPLYLILFLFSVMYELVLYAFGIRGIIAFVKQKNHQSVIILLVLLLAYLLVSAGLVSIFSSYRYRMPLEVLIILVASGFWEKKVAVKSGREAKT